MLHWTGDIMNRTLAYLGALLPLTSSSHATAYFEHAGDGGEDTVSKNGRAPSSGTEEVVQEASAQNAHKSAPPAGSSTQSGSGHDNPNPGADVPQEPGGTTGGHSQVFSPQSVMNPEAAGMVEPGMSHSSGSGTHAGSTGSFGGGGSVGVKTGAPAAATGANASVDGGVVTDEDAMEIVLGGLAHAEGIGSNTSGTTTLEMKDLGPLTIAIGTATYTASGSEFADADTFAQVTGADYYWIYTVDGGPGLGGVGSHYDQSTTVVVAIDIEGDYTMNSGALDDFLENMVPEGALLVDNSGSEEYVFTSGNSSIASGNASITNDNIADGDAPANVLTSTTNSPGEGSISYVNMTSEMASLSLLVDARGVETLTFADGSLIQVEDEYSSLFGIVTGIA
jgi:hypothetical protein